MLPGWNGRLKSLAQANYGARLAGEIPPLPSCKRGCSATDSLTVASTAGEPRRARGARRHERPRGPPLAPGSLDADDTRGAHLGQLLGQPVTLSLGSVLVIACFVGGTSAPAR